MAQTLPQEALARVVQIPSYLQKSHGASVSKKALGFMKIAETLKMISRDQGLGYSIAEFKAEFGNNMSYARTAIKTHLERLAPELKARIVEDGDRLVIFANLKRE